VRFRTSLSALAALAALTVSLACGAQAQSPAVQLASGIRAYGDLNFDSAAALLRAALASPGVPPLTDAERVRGLVHLGATELFRERRDSAAAAFQALLFLEPRYRPDQLVFPPEVSSLFEEVRLRTRGVKASVPPVTRLDAPGDQVVVWLYATSYHQIDVAILRANGVRVRSVYAGAAGDSLQLPWDGRTDTGALVESGSYQFEVDSRGTDGRVVRSLVVPLSVERLVLDTLPLPAPPDALMLPEREAGHSGLRALLTGLVGAAAVLALPEVVAGGSGGGGMVERFAVVGALGTSGLATFLTQRRATPIPENVAANQAVRASWRAQTEVVRAANGAIRQEVHLVIRARSPLAGEGP
jgi:hypothetical protein